MRRKKAAALLLLFLICGFVGCFVCGCRAGTAEPQDGAPREERSPEEASSKKPSSEQSSAEEPSAAEQSTDESPADGSSTEEADAEREASKEALVRELERRYGLSIYTGEDAIRPFADYAALPLYEADTVVRSLEQVRTVFDALPDGFVQTLLAGTVPSMSLYITGRIIGDSEQTAQPLAFTYADYMDGEYRIVIDGRDPSAVARNLAHELMHVIDTRITEEVGGGFNGFSEWEDHQPEGFVYAYTYRGDDGTDYGDRTWTAEDPREGLYFIDAYSKTFPIEDRARLFETLFMAGLAGRSLAEYAGTPLMEKAELLCRVIREGLLAPEDDAPVWELALARP